MFQLLTHTGFRDLFSTSHKLCQRFSHKHKKKKWRNACEWGTRRVYSLLLSECVCACAATTPTKLRRMFSGWKNPLRIPKYYQKTTKLYAGICKVPPARAKEPRLASFLPLAKWNKRSSLTNPPDIPFSLCKRGIWTRFVQALLFQKCASSERGEREICTV